MVAPDVLMGIPVAAGEGIVIAAPDLHEPNAPLEETPGREALLGEMPGFFIGVDFRRPRFGTAVESVEFQYMLRLGLKIQRVRGRQLHPGRQFVALDARLQPLIALSRGRVLLIEAGEQRLSILLTGGIDILACWVRVQVGNGIARARINDAPAVL